MLFGYARVSTRGQARDGNSLDAQKKAFMENGVKEENIFYDSMTGAKTDRPQLNALIKILQPGDTMMITKLDRIARSVNGGSEIIEGLLNRGVCVHVLNMGRMDNTSTGKLIRHIMLSFAEFERDLIYERTMDGKEMAKLHNPSYREGRPNKYTDAQRNLVLTLLENHSYNETASMTGMSRSTVARIRRENPQYDSALK